MKKLALFAFVSMPLLLGTSSCAVAQTSTNKFRVMTYNIQWFSEDANPERVSNLKKILDTVKPNIVGFQECQSKAAMKQIFNDDWTIGMLDDAREHQEVGIAVKAPFKLVKYDMLFTSPALDFAFPGKRDVLRAEVQIPSGETVVLYVNHFKSRSGGRWVTDVQREQAAGILAGFLASQKNEKSIVLGDLNDTPDDRSINILESGNAMAQGGPSVWNKPLLINLTEPLYRKNYVSLDLDRKYVGEPIDPVVPGAYASNEELRGKEHRFPQDVKVIQTLFDQILISPSLSGWYSGKTTIYSGSEALTGSKGRTQRDDTNGTVNYIEKGSMASDHLPVYADFEVK